MPPLNTQYISNSGLFTIDAIEVKGNSHYTAEEIINIGHATSGRNIIYKANIKETLEKNAAERAEAEAVPRHVHPERQQKCGKGTEQDQRQQRKLDPICRHHRADGRDHTARNRDGVRNADENDLSPFHGRTSFFGAIR